MDMNLAYLAAGALALLGAAIHGGVGQALIVSKLDAGTLPYTRFGSGRATRDMIRGGWHMLTLTFAGLGIALASCGARESSSCEGIGTLAAAMFTGFAVIAVAGPVLRGSPRLLIRHPAPMLLSAMAALTWLGR